MGLFKNQEVIPKMQLFSGIGLGKRIEKGGCKLLKVLKSPHGQIFVGHVLFPPWPRPPATTGRPSILEKAK